MQLVVAGHQEQGAGVALAVDASVMVASGLGVALVVQPDIGHESALLAVREVEFPGRPPVGHRKILGDGILLLNELKIVVVNTSRVEIGSAVDKVVKIYHDPVLGLHVVVLRRDSPHPLAIEIDGRGRDKRRVCDFQGFQARKIVDLVVVADRGAFVPVEHIAVAYCAGCA